MGLDDKILDVSLPEVLAQIRAIRIAMIHGAITYETAKKHCEPLLQKVNQRGVSIARKYGIKHKRITFHDLGRNI